MLGTTRKVRVLAHRHPTDMRKSFHTLAALVVQQLKADVMVGDLFLFVGRDLKRAKVLYFDGTGLCLFSKLLSQGRFQAPWDVAGDLVMTQSELALFLEGAQQMGRLSPAVITNDALHVRPEDFR